MPLNHLTIAWRQLRKHPTFSAINVLGLTLGFAGCLVIFHYLRFEHSYDAFHQKADHIYRVPMAITETGGAPQTFAFTYPAVGPQLKADFPEVEAFVRWRRQSGIVEVEGQVFWEDNSIFFVDRSVFDIFSFPFAKGNPAVALADLRDVVITQPIAQKYFGDADPLGQTLHYQGADFRVTGVLEALPANSHLQFGFLFNFELYTRNAEAQGSTIAGNWRWSDFYTYILLRPGTNAQALQAKLPALVERFKGEDMRTRGYTNALHLQPLRDIHLKSPYDYELPGNGNYTYLGYLGLAGWIILFIAWINYVNLTTARSLDRAREVGVRKVLGADRRSLVRQFLLESMLVNLVALVLGYLVFRLSLPAFRELTGRELPGLSWDDLPFWSALAGLFLLGALLAGLYPALALSGYRPVEVIKGRLSSLGSNRTSVLRKGLVLVQFAVAVLLLAGVVGLVQQLNYMRRHDMGVDISQTLVVKESIYSDSTHTEKVAAFLAELERHPDVLATTASSDIPGKEISGSTAINRKGREVEKRCRLLGVADDFFEQYDIDLVAGRGFARESGAAPLNILLNETATAVFGFTHPEAAIGQELQADEQRLRVIGVVRDYHQEALRYSFNPTVFYPVDNAVQYYSLKIQPTDVADLTAFVETTWKAHFPAVPFQHFLLEDFYDAQYKADRRFGAILGLFAALAIVVACLGLFGLSSYAVARRAKEISIRKVLGASVAHAVSLIVREYLYLVLIAALMGLPLAYFLVQRWLADFAFRTDLGGWFFLLPVALLLLITLLTAGGQSLRAALAKPVDALRAE